MSWRQGPRDDAARLKEAEMLIASQKAVIEDLRVRLAHEEDEHDRWRAVAEKLRLERER